jgi:Ca2+/Na+ antiporter
LVIILASELIVNAADNLKRSYTPEFIGGSILGLLTNLPDIFIIFAAVLTFSGKLALATVLGGNILAFTLGYSLVIAANAYYNKEELMLSKDVRRELVYLVSSSAIVLVGAAAGKFYWWAGALMCTLFIVYMGTGIRNESRRALNLKNRLKGFSLKEKAIAQSMVGLSKKTFAVNAAKIVVGAFILTYSAKPFVTAIVSLSGSLGIPLLLTGVLIAPIAAEAPELVSTVILSKRSMEDAIMAVTNIVGSKVQSNTFVLGLAIILASILGTPIETGGQFGSILVLVLINLYGLRATYDLALTKRDAVISLLLYPIVIGALAFF